MTDSGDIFFYVNCIDLYTKFGGEQWGEHKEVEYLPGGRQRHESEMLTRERPRAHCSTFLKSTVRPIIIGKESGPIAPYLALASARKKHLERKSTVQRFLGRRSQFSLKVLWSLNLIYRVK